MPTYDRNFNNPMVIFTAFPGNMKTDLPMLNWVTVSLSSLGIYADHAEVWDNESGNFILTGYAYEGCEECCYFDYELRRWIYHAKPVSRMCYAGNGVFISYDGRYTHKSYDGINWSSAGIIPACSNDRLLCITSDGRRAAAAVHLWYNPIAYTNDINSGIWSSTGAIDYLRAPEAVFKTISFHKGTLFGNCDGKVGPSYANYSGALGICSGGPLGWNELMQTPYDNGTFTWLQSSHGRLFLRHGYNAGSGWMNCFSVLNDSGTAYRVILEQPDATHALIPQFTAIVWCRPLQHYIAFASRTAYFSPDGYNWTEKPQTNFAEWPGDAIYIPKHGFYVTDYRNGGLWFAEYTV